MTWAFGAQGAAIVLQLAQIALLTRLLDIDAFGRYAYAGAISATAGIVFDFGLSVYLVPKVARRTNDAAYCARLLGAVFVAKTLLLGLVLICLLAISQSLTMPITEGVAALAIASGWVATVVPIWLLQGLQQFRLLAVVSISGGVAALVAMTILVRDSTAVSEAIAAQLIASGVQNWFCLSQLRRRGISQRRPSLRLVRTMLYGAADYFVSRLAVSVYTSIPTLLLGSSGPIQIALFSAAEKVFRGLQQAFMPFAQVAYPWMAATSGQRPYLRFIGMVMGMAALVAIVVGLAAELLVTLAFGSNYVAAVPLLDWLLVAFLANTLAVLLGYPLLEPHGWGRLANRSVQYSAVLFGVGFVAMDSWAQVDAGAMVRLILATELFVLVFRLALAARLPSRR